MKRLLVSIITLLLILVGCSSQSPDEKVTEVVNSYLQALETKDILSLVKYSDDLRFPDKKEQKREYSTIDDEINNTKIIEIKKANETEYAATVEFVSNGKFYELTFPVKKEKRDWKVIVGQDIH